MRALGFLQASVEFGFKLSASDLTDDGSITSGVHFENLLAVGALDVAHGLDQSSRVHKESAEVKGVNHLA